MPVSGLGFRGNCEDEKNREKISSLDFLLLLCQDKSKEEKKRFNKFKKYHNICKVNVITELSLHRLCLR